MTWWNVKGNDDRGASGPRDDTTYPDLRTFRAYEALLSHLHGESMLIHFGTTAFQGSISTMQASAEASNTLQRLGPIPNWSMGAGWDGGVKDGNQEESPL